MQQGKSNAVLLEFSVVYIQKDSDKKGRASLIIVLMTFLIPFDSLNMFKHLFSL